MDAYSADYSVLLPRPEIRLPLPHSLLDGKRILITGGGGSIGSEICRQIAAAPVRELTIADISENGVYALQQELLARYGSDLPFRIEIASIRDRSRIWQLFTALRPDVVFHAAAHKHVPLMEACPGEAIKNNVFGTRNVLEAAQDAGTERFLLISTDKAVHPSSVMGATKLLAERLTGLSWGRMICSTVRFGNVLGSAGSVLPLFQRQIDAGGPVLVTDRRMSRYFMTIPEAVSLVLEAASQAQGGEIFILDMEEPVSILSLAEKLIRLHGRTPYKEVPIRFTGLRPGEKLTEELLTPEEARTISRSGRILAAHPSPVSAGLLTRILDALQTAALSDSQEEQRRTLFQAVQHLTDEQKSPVF